MKHKIKRGKYQIPINDSTYRHFLKLRVMGIVVFFMYAVIIFITGLFVYKNVYSTIGFIDISAVAGLGDTSETINFNLLEVADTFWSEKHATSTVSFTRDPFSEAASLPTSQLDQPIIPEPSDSKDPLSDIESSI